VKCEENEKQAEEDALKTILEENECRRKRTVIPAENTLFRVGGHIVMLPRSLVAAIRVQMLAARGVEGCSTSATWRG